MNRHYINVPADIFDHEIFADEPHSRRSAWLLANVCREVADTADDWSRFHDECDEAYSKLDAINVGGQP